VLLLPGTTAFKFPGPGTCPLPIRYASFLPVRGVKKAVVLFLPGTTAFKFPGPGTCPSRSDTPLSSQCGALKRRWCFSSLAPPLSNSRDRAPAPSRPDTPLSSLCEALKKAVVLFLPGTTAFKFPGPGTCPLPTRYASFLPVRGVKKAVVVFLPGTTAFKFPGPGTCPLPTGYASILPVRGVKKGGGASPPWHHRFQK
jgi:hypothetical protein